MLGSGIFVLPGMAIAETGPSAWLAYLLASFAVLPAATSKSELATAMPSSGGTYIYLERTFGPLVGTLSGLGLWLSLLLKSSFALIGIGAYLTVITDFDKKAISIGILLLIVAVNILGVGKVGTSIVFIVIISLLTLTAIGIISLPLVDLELASPFMTDGISGLFSATGLVFVSYAGVTKVAAIAEEVKNPKKNLPLGILISLLTVTIAYCVITFILTSSIPSTKLQDDLKPIYSLALEAGGPYIGMATALVAILTMASMANSGVLASSRFPFAMARDNLLPSAFCRINKRFLTPHIAILFTGLFAFCSILFLDVGRIAKLASAFILIIYIVENLAVIVLRETRVQWYSPKFRSPMYPMLQLLGIVSGIVLLIGMGYVVISAIFGIGIPGILLYFFYSQHNSNRKGVVGVRVRRKEFEAPSQTMASDRAASVIVPLFGSEKSPEILVVLATILAGEDTVEVVHLTEVPMQSDLHDLDELETRRIKSLRRRIATIADKTSANIDFDHVPSHDIYKVLYDISAKLHCQWLLKEWGGRSLGTFTIYKPIGWLGDHLDCNIINFKDAGIRYISKIMLILPNDESDTFFVDTAHRIATAMQATLEVVGFVYEDISDERSNRTVKNIQRIDATGMNNTHTRVISGKHFVSTIIDAAVDYDLLILCSEENPTVKERFLGSDQDKIIENSNCSVLGIKRRRVPIAINRSLLLSN